MSDGRSRGLLLTLLSAGLLLIPASAECLEPATETPAVSAPLSLARATELALGNGAAVAAAAAAARGDQASARLAADAFRPEADVSTTPGVGRGLPVAVAGRVPSIVTVDFRQSLFNSELRATELAARANATTTRAVYERARLQTAREIADLYARCWSGQQLAAGAERRSNAFAAMSRRVAALHDQGRATDLDLAQARLREARARLRRMEVAATRDFDLWELKRRLGLAAETPLTLPEDPLAAPPDPTSGARGDDLAAASAADPDLLAANQAIELLLRARKLREGWLAPITVDVDAQYSRLSRANGIDQFYVKFREDDWSIALAVAVPLWNGGRLRDGLARADANLDRLKQQQRARAEQLEIEVRRAQSTLDQAQAALGVASQAGAVADEDLRISGALAAEGRAFPDDLDGREAARADAQEEVIKATAALLNARVQLLAVRGDLLTALGVEPPGAASPQAPTALTRPPSPPPAHHRPDGERPPGLGITAGAAGSPSPRR